MMVQSEAIISVPSFSQLKLIVPHPQSGWASTLVNERLARADRSGMAFQIVGAYRRLPYH
jgi:hypothetical protein